MSSNVVALKPKPLHGKLQCNKCGIEQDAACGCGVGYSSAGERAAAAVEASPEKSNRAIAAETGVDESTVRKARKESTAGNPAVEKRVGLDGKARKQPKPKDPAPVDTMIRPGQNTYSSPQAVHGDMPTQEEADESYQQTLYDHACLIVDKEMSGETRQRFFAHLKRKYDNAKFNQSPSQRGDKGLPA